jgi:hypothetical protein
MRDPSERSSRRRWDALRSQSEQKKRQRPVVLKSFFGHISRTFSGDPQGAPAARCEHKPSYVMLEMHSHHWYMFIVN